MYRKDILSLCNKNYKLKEYAAILFAEISELISTQSQPLDLAVLKVVESKVEEFPLIVIQEAIKDAEQ